jgi:hypothetical protein
MINTINNPVPTQSLQGIQSCGKNEHEIQIMSKKK